MGLRAAHPNFLRQIEQFHTGFVRHPLHQKGKQGTVGPDRAIPHPAFVGNDRAACAVDQATLDRLSQAFPQARIRHVYASTEAGVIFTVADQIQATQGVECRKDENVIDEIPMAYKDIDAVMAAQKDLVEVVYTLKQVLCVKG